MSWQKLKAANTVRVEVLVVSDDCVTWAAAHEVISGQCGRLLMVWGTLDYKFSGL